MDAAPTLHGLPPEDAATARGSGWLPLVGHAATVLRDPLAALDTWARERGDLYRLQFLGVDNWFVNRPAEIERVLTSPRTRRDADIRRMRELLGNGLLTAEGELWKRQRRLMQPAFHRERVAGYGRAMVELTSAQVERWEDGPRDFNREMMALTLKIAAATLFGDGGVDPEEVGGALDGVMRRFVGAAMVIPTWLPTPATWRFHRAIRSLDRIVRQVIARRRAHPLQGGADLLSLLLQAQDEDGSRMSDTQLRDEVLTLLLAGHETTANALTWSGHLLAQHPEVAGRLCDEASALGGPAAAADLPRLPYTSAVLQEVMRLYPPAWAVGRELTEPLEVGGHLLPAGTQVTFSQWVVHRDERYFRDALAFRPERWLDGSLSGLPAYAYFPFGGGQRLCIGKQFAIMEGVLVLAELGRRFRFRPVPGVEVRVLPSITLRPRGGLPLHIERR